MMIRSVGISSSYCCCCCYFIRLFHFFMRCKLFDGVIIVLLWMCTHSVRSVNTHCHEIAFYRSVSVLWYVYTTPILTFSSSSFSLALPGHIICFGWRIASCFFCINFFEFLRCFVMFFLFLLLLFCAYDVSPNVIGVYRLSCNLYVDFRLSSLSLSLKCTQLFDAQHR